MIVVNSKSSRCRTRTGRARPNLKRHAQQQDIAEGNTTARFVPPVPSRIYSVDRASPLRACDIPRQVFQAAKWHCSNFLSLEGLLARDIVKRSCQLSTLTVYRAYLNCIPRDVLWSVQALTKDENDYHDGLPQYMLLERINRELATVVERRNNPHFVVSRTVLVEAIDDLVFRILGVFDSVSVLQHEIRVCCARAQNLEKIVPASVHRGPRALLTTLQHLQVLANDARIAPYMLGAPHEPRNVKNDFLILAGAAAVIAGYYLCLAHHVPAKVAHAAGALLVDPSAAGALCIEMIKASWLCQAICSDVGQLSLLAVFIQFILPAIVHAVRSNEQRVADA